MNNQSVSEQTCTGMGRLKISVIIPGWNEAKNVSACLLSLRQQTYDCFNVFMVLGGEDPAYVETVRKQPWERLTVLDQTIPNKMKACNSVLQHPDLGDILLFSDMDCEFPSNFLSKYAEAFSDPEKNIITGRVRPMSRARNLIDRYHRCFEETISPKARKVVTGIMGANFAVRKNFFLEKFGHFDESVIVGTDHAIARRFRAIGEPIHFNPYIVVETQIFSGGAAKYIDQQSRWIRIRISGSRGRNPKAFRNAMASLVFAWGVVFALPLLMFLVKGGHSRAAAAGWWILATLWGGLLATAWWKRLKILRYGQKDGRRRIILMDMASAFILVWIHCSIRIIASIQMIFFRKRR